MCSSDLLERGYEDWVNSLMLSIRFTAHREGDFNEYLMTFFKTLSPSRIDLIERIYAADGGASDAEEFFERDGWRIERYCPHRQADLAEFGSIEGDVLTCAVHHWRFDLSTGRCLTSDDRTIACSRIADAEGDASS